MIIYKYNFIRKTMRVFNYTIDTTLSYLFCIIIYYNNRNINILIDISILNYLCANHKYIIPLTKS